MFKRIVLFTLLGMFLVNYIYSQQEVGMKKILMIIAANGFRDEELLKPKEIFEKNGFSVIVASTSLQVATGMLGAKIKPDILISDVNIDDYEAIVFVGGVGASCYWQDSLAHRIAQDAYNKGKIVSAICIAPVTLANAGLLSGKKATVWESEAGQLKKKGALYTGKSVEKDGRIITASGPFAAEEFGNVILEELSK
ncbi:MAG: DJ-1/PfpI family protein [Candidatus Omnitrophica bacterium]|nr:DJ-1/PfpI family protein [Candidatus Omnitrophota bacterium]